MSEWHLTPEYIMNNWTDELLDLMVNKMVERKRGYSVPDKTINNEVSIDTLAANSRGLIKVVKK